MLSLKDFKAVKIDDNASIAKITGGIACDDIDRVMKHLWENNLEQFQAVLETFSGTDQGGGGYTLQCD